MKSVYYEYKNVIEIFINFNKNLSIKTKIIIIFNRKIGGVRRFFLKILIYGLIKQIH